MGHHFNHVAAADDDDDDDDNDFFQLILKLLCINDNHGYMQGQKVCLFVIEISNFHSFIQQQGKKQFFLRILKSFFLVSKYEKPGHVSECFNDDDDDYYKNVLQFTGY